MQETVLELKNYSVSFDTPDGEVQAVRNVDLTVKKGEILCIVGESGCGKTASATECTCKKRRDQSLRREYHSL